MNRMKVMTSELITETEVTTSGRAARTATAAMPVTATPLPRSRTIGG
jgi:hypothetical protein